MKLGRLDTFIEIVRDGITGRDEFNAPIYGPVPLASAMAERVQASGREFLAADAVQNEQRVVFRLHWLPDITTKDRVRCAGQTYNIHEVRPLGRSRHMELHTATRAP
ncbi:phage head closure protein [Brevundimonas sp.]|uniref:phage head closure protein n=1 Tax=Brevundimonas sp. TaxID=1871086 RepID=UPI0025C4BFF4|nr:phage head closure protein [Brevundimonas sp.]